MSPEAWILAGADVATPNKRAGSGPFTRYACRACAASIAFAVFRVDCRNSSGEHWFYFQEKKLLLNHGQFE